MTRKDINFIAEAYLTGKEASMGDWETEWDDMTPPNEEVDAEQLNIGIEVEKEHTDDEELAEEIARDHLAEDPHYYSKLKKAGL